MLISFLTGTINVLRKTNNSDFRIHFSPAYFAGKVIIAKQMNDYAILIILADIIDIQ